jgi:hypothetical protein
MAGIPLSSRLLGEVRVQSSEPTLRTEACREWGSIPDTEAVEDTAISLGLDVEVTDSLGGDVRLRHLDVTVRTGSFAHGSVPRFADRTEEHLAAVSLVDTVGLLKKFDGPCRRTSSSEYVRRWELLRSAALLVEHVLYVVTATLNGGREAGAPRGIN